MGILPDNIFDIMQKWELNQIEKQKEIDERYRERTQEEKLLLKAQYRKTLSTWQVRKVYEVELTSSVCCEECNEIVNNSLEICPICKTEDVEIDEGSSLVESGWEVITIQCYKCKSYFKLVTGSWYGYPEDPKVVQISKEEEEAENGVRDAVDKANYYSFVSKLKLGE